MKRNKAVDVVFAGALAVVAICMALAGVLLWQGHILAASIVAWAPWALALSSEYTLGWAVNYLSD